MPSFKKKALSLYFRNGCQRQFILSLYSDPDLRNNHMPPRQQARAGLSRTAQVGYDWQEEKINELEDVFGKGNILVNPQKKGNRPQPLDLLTHLPQAQAYQFIVESDYIAKTQQFMAAVGIENLCDFYGQPLGVANARPDLIQVLPPAVQRTQWERDKQKSESGPCATMQEVLPNGDIRAIAETDERLRLRVIDIKLAAEPGAHYFAEVVYYAITLAAWMQEHGFSEQFVVVAAPAVWPGSYEASHIRLLHNQSQKQGQEPGPAALAAALEEDIEVAPFDVFAPRLRRFFAEELPAMLQTPWNQLPWHVTHTCKGCEFLGYPWRDKDGNLTSHKLHCWQEAERIGHLSRITGLTRGSAKLLGTQAVDVAALAALSPTNTAFAQSPSLRAKRTIYPFRAQSLEQKTTSSIPDSGSDALMPRWPNLHIYLFLDYDLASAITTTFAVSAFWNEPLPYTTQDTSQNKRWVAFDGKERTGFQEVYVVDQRDVTRERDELLKFLRALHKIMKDVIEQDDTDCQANRRGNINDPNKLKRSTYQIYLWDEGQRKQLTRVVGRHLDAILADTELRDLAWLFPPPELLTHAEEASYTSPFTLVSTVVQNTVAVPIPHHYTLLDVAQTYHHVALKDITVHPLYREPLSDLIPGERLHELWTRHGNYAQTLTTIAETTAKKLSALRYVVQQLEEDLKPLLSRAAAPPLQRTTTRLNGVSVRSMLWYEYTRLNNAVTELEEHTLRAMPAYEREARFKSAHLVKRLEGQEKLTAYAMLQQAASQQLPAAIDLLIYQLHPDSYEFNVRPPELGFALAPRSNPAFLNDAAYPIIKKAQIDLKANPRGTVADVGLTKVSVAALDRIKGLIALKVWYTTRIEQIEQFAIADLSKDVMLDPVGEDFLSSKLFMTLRGIGNPPSAGIDADALRALGTSATPSKQKNQESPASEFLWQATRLTQTTVVRDMDAIRTHLESCGQMLNQSQWDALSTALTRRLTLIWGPPGTGKSEMLRALIAGAIWHAQHHEQPLRILVASNTYTAIDNLLLKVDDVLANVITTIPRPYRIVRLQSQYNNSPVELAKHPTIEQMIVKTKGTSQEVLDLQQILETSAETFIVGAPPQQLHNLTIATSGQTKTSSAKATQRRWFDLIIIDEASQLGVAESTLVVSKAAQDAAFVLAGDDKQLPPIQPAPPPEKLEDVVGSVYAYMRHHHNVHPQPLQINYRSCQTLVDFTKRAGYDPGLTAYHPNLHLSLLPSGFPKERPSDWPASLYWTDEWVKLLDPSHSATCFIYQDDVAGQSNPFEANAVAALLWLLYRTLDKQLANERNGEADVPVTGTPHDEKTFWEQAVGVVTPHRAQMSTIVSQLQVTFPTHSPTAIWNAVDTVERFQGQQRDVIIASFGLGDTDLIRSEDEFLYSLNRFNVMASRARAKLIVFLTRSLVDHLADDVDVLQQSRLLKNYAETFCQSPTLVTLGFRINSQDILKPGTLRTR